MIVAMPYQAGAIQSIHKTSLWVLYELENNAIVRKELFQPRPPLDTLIEQLYRMQVNQVIFKQMEADFKFDLDYYKMRYVSGAKGDCDAIMEQFLAGHFEED